MSDNDFNIGDLVWVNIITHTFGSQTSECRSANNKRVARANRGTCAV
jgi:hypothetical protein